MPSAQCLLPLPPNDPLLGVYRHADARYGEAQAHLPSSR